MSRIYAISTDDRALLELQIKNFKKEMFVGWTLTITLPLLAGYMESNSFENLGVPLFIGEIYGLAIASYLFIYNPIVRRRRTVKVVYKLQVDHEKIMAYCLNEKLEEIPFEMRLKNLQLYEGYNISRKRVKNTMFKRDMAFTLESPDLPNPLFFISSFWKDWDEIYLLLKKP